MGAWGFRNFQNDCAGDWVVNFQANPNWAFVEKTILQRNSNGTIPNEAEALAAIEVIAVVKGNPPKDYSEVDFNLKKVLDNLPPLIKEELIYSAIETARTILNNSTLKVLIQEVDAYQEWSEIIEDLVKRVEKTEGSI